ncbi:uncharacterized protein LOC129968368 [Argiope bruennichi]|uniref:uncharacterized protein LOC129968368 n=1 Tax=Argiope bruennichi TaxID=94029 RepID=UPI002494421F|nr:uncharacterized protein LOC129968368 [Argiope bruennichi]
MPATLDVVEHNKNETFSSVSPFLVQKAVAATVGEVTSIRKMRSGDLLVEVNSRKQAQQLQKLKALATIAITVSPHQSLNTSKGVITCGELLNVPLEIIKKEMKPQGVIDVRRINIKKDGQLMETKHHILTFQTPNLPEFAYAGYIRLPVRPYIPNPLRCFQCQRFGHSKLNCRGSLTCARCATRRKVQTQTPTPGISYSSAVKTSFCENCSCKNCKNLATKPRNPRKNSDSDTDHSTSAPETSQVGKLNPKAKRKSQNSLKLQLAKRGLSHKDLTLKLKKSKSKNSVALGLATQGVVHKDLTSIFGDIPHNNPDIKLHPSEDDDDLEMSCEIQATPTTASSGSSSKRLS